MNLIRRLFFLFWYFRDPPWDTHQTPPELFDYIETTPPGRALDLGCGTGTNVITLAQHGWEAYGIDFIPKAIRTARRNAAQNHVNAHFRIGDVTKLSFFTEPFDLILDIGCYQSLERSGMKAYQDNIRRLLATGGTYLLYLFFQSGNTMSGSHATEEDLKPFLNFLDLISRQNGTERGIRPSSWLTYRKPEQLQ